MLLPQADRKIIVLAILLSVWTNVSGSSSSFGATVISSILKSPLYAPIVLLARNTMVKTAQNAGLDWPGKAARLRTEFFANNAPTPEDIMNENPTLITEDYYKSKFHGYANGNLCLEAAIEQEIAGKAVGARNFPAEGLNGEVVVIINTAMYYVSVCVCICRVFCGAAMIPRYERLEWRHVCRRLMTLLS